MKLNYTEKATLTEYYKALLKNADKSDVLKFLNGEIEYPDDAPFLSIIMRTQGKRTEALSEVLLCLSGQSDADFEVLLMGHNLDEKGKDTVEGIISKQSEGLRQKIRLIEVRGGSRTTPLNRGFESACGRYVSILDDDDLVLENWVECFHRLEEQNRGKILHTYCVTQDWKSITSEYGETVLVSVSKFNPIYCRDFDFTEQYITNYCPTFSLAFPSAAFKFLGIHFDESLTTTEDWDFLMRTAEVCGVADEPTVTGIYRKWINSENSATIHNECEWRNNYRRIQKKLLKGPMLIPCEAPQKLFESQGVKPDLGVLRKDEFSVIIDTADKKGVKAALSFEFDDAVWTVRVKETQSIGKIDRISIIPAKKGSVALHGLIIKISDINGKGMEFSREGIKNNGIKKGDTLAFLYHPRCSVTIEPTEVAAISIEFAVDYGFAGPRIKRALLAVPRKIKRVLIKIAKKLLRA